MNKLFSKYNLKNIAIILLIAIFFVSDRLLKVLSISGRKSFSLIGDILTFSFTPNYFIAFSLPVGGKILEVTILILIVLMIVFSLYLLFKKYSVPLIIGLAAIILGAVSNYIDRLRLGYVIDYLYLKYFTVFNLADALIAFGTILILIYIYLDKKTDH